jgi:hypothetical protein
LLSIQLSSLFINFVRYEEQHESLMKSSAISSLQITDTLALLFFIFFSLLLRKSNSKHSNIFSLFILHQSFFITIQIKKIYYKTKFFHFFIKQFQTFFYFISHQSLLTTIQTNIPQHNHLISEARLSPMFPADSSHECL